MMVRRSAAYSAGRGERPATSAISSSRLRCAITDTAAGLMRCRRGGGEDARMPANRAGDARLSGPRVLPQARLRNSRPCRRVSARARVPDDGEALAARGRAWPGAPIRIRPARPGEAPALSALCVRSKAHWGYDAEFMRLSWRSLQIDPDGHRRGPRVRRRRRARPAAGRGGLLRAPANPARSTCCTCSSIRRPSRRGVGRALFAAACRVVRGPGRRRLLILSDPNAVAFYRRLGARRSAEGAVRRRPGSGLAAARVCGDVA